MTIAARPALDAVDQHLLNEMQDKFPLVREPFSELARRVGVSEEDTMERIAAKAVGSTIRSSGRRC